MSEHKNVDPVRTAQDAIKLKRTKHSQRAKEKATAKDGYTLAEAIALLLFLLGVVLLINPFRWLVPFVDVHNPDLALTYGTAERVGIWMAHGGGATLFAILCLLVALVIITIRARERVNSRTDLWANQCPNCQHKDLKRVRRTFTERLLNRLGIPARRYICSHCSWKGTRIDHTRLHR